MFRKIKFPIKYIFDSTIFHWKIQDFLNFLHETLDRRSTSWTKPGPIKWKLTGSITGPGPTHLYPKHCKESNYRLERRWTWTIWRCRKGRSPWWTGSCIWWRRWCSPVRADRSTPPPSCLRRPQTPWESSWWHLKKMYSWMRKELGAKQYTMSARRRSNFSQLFI